MINFFDIKVGARVRLKDGREGAVVDNMNDGQWIEVTIDGAASDVEPELVHSEDLAQLLG